MQFQVKIQCYIRKGVIFLGIFANHSLDSGRITLPVSPSLPPPAPTGHFTDLPQILELCEIKKQMHFGWNLLLIVT